MTRQQKITELIEQKIFNLIDNQLKRIIKPTINLKDENGKEIKIKEVKDITLEIVKKLKKEYGIGGLIIDVDGTIRKNMMDIPDCNKEWMQYMKKEFKVFILTNGLDKKISDYAKRIGIGCIQLAKKPLKKGFYTACKDMGLEPENVLVIGNDIICDIFGGNRAGMFTMLIKDLNQYNNLAREM